MGQLEGAPTKTHVAESKVSHQFLHLRPGK
jgi:hypothetical protein